MDKKKLLQAAFYCHRRPERSFFWGGYQLPLCARCSGILVGYLIGLAIGLLCGEIGLLMIFALLIPLVVDGVLQLQGYWMSSNYRRLFTGMLFGVGIMHFIFWICMSGYHNGVWIGENWL